MPLPAVEKTVEESWVPKVGMVFETDEKAYCFYCDYGKEMGFGVLKHLVKRRASGVVYSRVFSCYKEGFCRTIRPGKKPRPDTRTGCQVHITVRIMDDGQHQVCEFEPEHNHEFVQKAPNTVADTSTSGAPTQRVIAKNAGKGALAVRCLPLKKLVPSKCLNSAQVGSAAVIWNQMELQGSGVKISAVTASEDPNNQCMPKIDMEFEDDEQAYQFYVNYAEATGFSVRKHLMKRRTSGVIYSRMFVCHKEGFHRKRDEEEGRKPKPYDRTGCLASLTVRITKHGRYRVAEFEPKHNHPLVIPSKAHLLRWRWRRRPVNTTASWSDLEEDWENIQEHDDVRANGQDEDNAPPTFILVGYKNYISSKRTNASRLGDLGALLQYLHEKQVADPSFYYGLQLDQDDQVANIFWMDYKSIMDFQCFGDVVCFDTTYRTRDYNRPFAPFLGVNHHKQAIVFASALLYDETEESFKWLFETFKTAMCGKQPKVILTDCHVAMNNVIATVWPNTSHRFCVWQIYNNAAKHLSSVFQGSICFTKDFSRCLYDNEAEEDFSVGWKRMVEHYDLQTNDWLAKLYEDREKWALAYSRDTFCTTTTTTTTKKPFIPN